MSAGSSKAGTAKLREQAEATIRGLAKGRPQTSATNALRLVHELEVHQIELLMQNDELRAAQATADDALRRYTELFDFAPVGYVSLADDETVEEANLTARSLLAGQGKRLVGRAFSAFVVPADQLRVRTLLGNERRDCHGSPAFEAELQGPSGAPFAAEIRIQAAAHDGRKLLVAFQDVSERTMREAKLREAREELRETDRRKDEFMAMLSHELRNPLSPIRSSLFIVAHAPSGSDVATQALAVIERQVTHLSRLVDDLLDVTRIAHGRIDLRRETLNLSELVRQTVEDHRASFRTSGVALDLRIQASPVWVDGDSARIIQAISNLLGNSKKFTRAGGRATVEVSRETENAVVSIHDTGVGIAAKDLARVFEPFTQAPQPMDRARGGLGLGLAMVKGFVEMHGGTVHIASEGYGHGTEVTLSFPSVDGPEEPVTPEPKGATRSHRVLVIEDNADVADSLQAALSIAGHDVAVAYDGPRGLELAREFRPEIVLCDIGLPDMDGYAVAQAFRADDRLRAIYLVALSGYSRLEDRRHAIAAGFDQYVAKPPSIEALDRLLSEVPGVIAVASPSS